MPLKFTSSHMSGAIRGCVYIYSFTKIIWFFVKYNPILGFTCLEKGNSFRFEKMPDSPNWLVIYYFCWNTNTFRNVQLNTKPFYANYEEVEIVLPPIIW